jgi:uncharacterized protein
MTGSPRWQDGPATLRVGNGGGDSGDGTGPGGDAAPPIPSVPLEIATSYRARTRGLLGRDGIDGAMLLSPASSVHTFRMRFAIDVVHLDRRSRVVAVRTMKPGRLGALRLRSRHILEMEAGAAARWGLRPGVTVHIDQEPTA